MNGSAIAAAIGLILGNLGVILFAVGASVAYLGVRRADARHARINAADRYWRELLFFAVGLTFIWYGLLHAFFQALSATYIGWSPTPFEFELGFAEIGIGAAALLARGRHYDLGLGITLCYAIFSLAAAAQHIYLIACCANLKPGNAGAIVWFNDIFVPLALVGLAWRARRGPAAHVAVRGGQGRA